MKGRPSCSSCHGREYQAAAEACPRCADVAAQVEDWLGAKCPPSVSGQQGHNAALQAAGALWGFYGTEGEVLAALTRWNGMCSPPWSERELRHKVSEARKGLRKEPGFLVWEPWAGRNGEGGSGARSNAERRTLNVERSRPCEEVGVAKPWDRKAFPFEVESLKKAAAAVGPVTREELEKRSGVRLDTVTPELFLSALYPAGSRVLVFTRFASQGQYLWEVPGRKVEGFRVQGSGGDLKPEPLSLKSFSGAWELGRTRGEKAARVARLPREGNCGVWFLNQPVDGVWRENPGKYRKDGSPEFSRRHEPCVTGWPYLVLESDIEGIEGLWVSYLAGLRLGALVAMYTSGGKSVHALIRMRSESKPEWDQTRDVIKPLLTKHGADPGVFSAVRLTRLPGCLRHGTERRMPGKPELEYYRYMGRDGKPEPRKQELIYFKPNAKSGKNIFEQ